MRGSVVSVTACLGLLFLSAASTCLLWSMAAGSVTPGRPPMENGRQLECCSHDFAELSGLRMPRQYVVSRLAELG